MADEGYVAPTIDTPNCISCNECINVNANIFVYDGEGKAIIKDANAGPYKHLVMAAEKCSASVIKPGLPADRSEKDIDKWIKRAQKFNEL
jgi:pyruvate-ferredoxin/flavodoxin oxidoreductase